VSSAATARRARQTVRDMVLSIALIMAIVGVVLLFQHRSGRGVPTIDPSSAYAGARNAASYPVLVPRLPATWRPTSARTQRSEDGHLTLRVGFLTPRAQYAGLVESDRPAASLLGQELSPGVRPAGQLTIDGRQWQRLPAPRAGDRAIARTQDGVTYLVTGSAGLAELQTLAGSLS